MIDHLSIVVANYRRSRAWYQAALAPLGYQLKTDAEQGAVRVAGFAPAAAAHGTLYLVSATLARGVCEPCPHFCLRADSREAVQAFHAAALQAGGEDNGAPGLRPEYGCYAAFVLDPDGYHVGVACYG